MNLVFLVGSCPHAYIYIFVLYIYTHIYIISNMKLKESPEFAMDVLFESFKDPSL